DGGGRRAARQAPCNFLLSSSKDIQKPGSGPPTTEKLEYAPGLIHDPAIGRTKFSPATSRCDSREGEGYFDNHSQHRSFHQRAQGRTVPSPGAGPVRAGAHV